MYYNTRVSQTNLYDLQFILDRMAWVACNPYSSGQHDEITTILRLVKFAQQNGFRLLPHKSDYKGDTTAHVKFVKYVIVRRVIIVFLSEIWSYRIVIISHLLQGLIVLNECLRILDQTRGTYSAISQRLTSVSVWVKDCNKRHIVVSKYCWLLHITSTRVISSILQTTQVFIKRANFF